jgi:hypothetical protein
VIYRALLRQYGVKVFSVSEPYDEDTPHGFLSNGILQLISQFYNMNLANEVKKGMVQNAKQGYHNGGIPPYGYITAKIRNEKNNEKSIWIPGRDEDVKTIQRIFDMYVYQNYGVKRIVNFLNTEGVPSPNGGLWSKSTVISILRNDTYIGVRTWNRRASSQSKEKYKPESEWIIKANAHQPLVSRDVFYLVKERAKERCPGSSTYWTPKGPSPFILRGLLKCHKCGANMVTGRNSLKSRGYSMTYFCGTYDRKGRGACERNSVSKQKLENAVVNTLIREFSILCIPGNLERAMEDYFEESHRDYDHRLAVMKVDIQHLERKLTFASNETAAGQSGDTGHIISQYIQSIESDLDILKAEHKELIEKRSVFEMKKEDLEVIRDGLNDFVNRIKTETPDVQYSLLHRYTGRICFDEYSNYYKMKIVIFSGRDCGEPVLIKDLCFQI